MEAGDLRLLLIDDPALNCFNFQQSSPNSNKDILAGLGSPPSLTLPRAKTRKGGDQKGMRALLVPSLARLRVGEG